ncbi:MAG: zinc-ribbon domain-containing protein [Clostridia bacterium]|nr:zinc-ribbon domain-containing protein [Clostridia bacterium]
MSLSVEGQKCPVCNSYLFDDDDIVFCPTCGAPHHRECYASLGHCALEADHGTERQYDANRAAEQAAEDAKTTEETPEGGEEPKTEKTFCFRCGTELSENDMFCPKCHAPRVRASYGPTPNMNFGFKEPKWKGETVIEDDITLNDVVPIVAVNAGRYSEKFIMLNKKHRASWNWAAFLFPTEWSFFRKNYLQGFLFGILQVTSALLMLPLERLIGNGILPDNPAPMQVFSLLEENPTAYVLALIGFLVSIGVAVFSGIFADYIYRGNCIEKAKRIKAAPESEREMLRFKLGGINPLWFMLAMMAESYIPLLISMFL